MSALRGDFGVTISTASLEWDFEQIRSQRGPQRAARGQATLGDWIDELCIAVLSKRSPARVC